MERELAQYQNRTGDPEVEKKLKKQVHKLKALLQVQCTFNVRASEVCVCDVRFVMCEVCVCVM